MQRRQLFSLGLGKSEVPDTLLALVCMSSSNADTLSRPRRRSAASHDPAAISVKASNTSAFSPAVCRSALGRLRTALMSTPRTEGSALMCSPGCDIPNAVWRASSCVASRYTAAVMRSGANRSTNHSRDRKVPSPSTESRNEAVAKSGSSISVCRDACPPAVESPGS